ncbi:MAG TPA: AsmA-like C-terminal region-containing protein, partial [Acetobacteraceae bacterium]|nr:AsmA-like C-terminal region-containing protein [Acetobacteraceae bacterium]
ELSWDGWREGASPFELRLRRVRAVDGTGGVRAELPDARVSVAYRWLLLGQLAPRRVELVGARLRVLRAEDGSMTLDLGSLGEGEQAQADTAGHDTAETLLRQLLDAVQGQAESSPLAALEAVVVRDARILVVDAQLDTVWSLENGNLAFARQEGATFDLQGRATLVLGEERVPARLSGALRGQPPGVEAMLTLVEVRPAALARQARRLAPLAALDAAASVELRVGARADGGGASAAMVVHVGPGQVALEPGSRIAIAGADISVIATPRAARLERAVLRLAPPEGGRDGPTLSLAGEAERREDGWQGTVRGHLDRVAIADLGSHWPTGLMPGARRWLTQNMTAGAARNGRFTVEARADPTLDALTVTAFTGTLEVEGATVHWLRPVPPVEGVAGTVEFGLREIVVQARRGRQQGTATEVRDGTLRFHSFDSGPGEAELDLRLAGPVADVLGVLRHPRLRLFDRSRVAVPELTGMVQDSRLRIGFPLLDRLPIEEVRMRAEARIGELRVPRAVLGRDLERGVAELQVDMDGLRAQAQAVLAEMPVRVGVEMDFRAGPATQVVERNTLSGRAEVRQLQALGLDLRDFAEGVVALEARREARRNGSARLALRGDLREARLAVAPLGWQKPRGAAGSVEAVLRMQGEQVQALEQLRIEAPDGLLRARGGAFRNGWPERLEIQEAVLGATRFAGEVRAPIQHGGEWTALLRGQSLDLTAVLADRGEDERTPAPAQPRPDSSTPVLADWRFERVILGERRALTAFAGRARLDSAGVLRAAEAEARFGNAGAQFRLVPQGTQRRLSIASDDGGGLLRLLDIVSSIQGGRLVVEALYEHGRPGAPLTGQAELSDFVVHDAPAIGKLLQAMTLYGLVEAVRGPGLGFTRLIAPFRLTPGALELEDARAFSASLGLTARGRIDRRRSTVDMEGTIVPAYFFNQLLGNIPILGRLFSPEAGGGLFAATYRIRGPLADPAVTVNPLAALTPGFLRGLFQLGQDGAPAPSQRQSAPSTPSPTRAQPVQEMPLRGPPPH